MTENTAQRKNIEEIIDLMVKYAIYDCHFVWKISLRDLPWMTSASGRSGKCLKRTKRKWEGESGRSAKPFNITRLPSSTMLIDKLRVISVDLNLYYGVKFWCKKLHGTHVAYLRPNNYVLILTVATYGPDALVEFPILSLIEVNVDSHILKSKRRA